MKKLKWVLLAFVLIVIVGVVAIVLNLNGIVRNAVERGASQSLALQTTLGNANVGLLSGDVSLGNLEIANPQGFSAPKLLTLGNISVDTSYGKVFGEPTAIDAISIEKPKLVLEFVGTKSNLKTVADNLAAGGTGDRPTEPVDPNAKPLKLIIDQLKVSGAQVEIISDIPGLGTPYTIDIPAVEMSKIGNADGNRNGEEAGKIVSQIIAQLTMEAQKTGKLPPQLAAILNTDLNSLVDTIGGQFKAQAMAQLDSLKGQAQEKVDEARNKAEGAIKDAQNKAQEQLDKVGGNLGGLLGGNKDKNEKKD